MGDLWITLVTFLHVLGAIVLIGTGAGIAFFMVMAHRSRDAAAIAHVAGTVVIADFLFTASAVVVQPITGLILALDAGWPLTSGWVFVSLLLYIFIGLFWLPVVFIQMKLRNIAHHAASQGAPLHREYHRLYRIWFACGFPAFFAILAILWLMLQKPDIGFGL